MTALWLDKFANSKYGWPSVKVDGANWNEFGVSVGGDALLEAFNTRGYEYDADNVYLRYEGYIKLGRSSKTGFVTIPALSDIDAGTVATVRVSFNSAWYYSAGGTGDDGKSTFQVSVIGSGEIASCGTTDAVVSSDGKSAEILTSSRWEWVEKSLIVSGADNQTRIRLGESAEVKARSFLDNIVVTRAVEGAVASADQTIAAPSLEKEITAITTGELSGDDFKFSVRVNRAWNIVSDSEWLTIKSVASGTETSSVSVAENALSADVAATCLFYNNCAVTAAVNNITSPRTAHITISADGVTLETIAVTQAAATPAPPVETLLPVAWTFGALTADSGKGADWCNSNFISADASDAARISFYRSPSNLPAMEIAPDGAGTCCNNIRPSGTGAKYPRTKSPYMGDYFLFTVPVKNIKSGDQIHFEGAILGVNQNAGPGYYVMAWSSNGTDWTNIEATNLWTQAQAVKVDGKESPITDGLTADFHYTFRSYNNLTPAVAANANVDRTFTIDKDIEQGTLYIRFMIASNRSINNSLIASSSNAGMAWVGSTKINIVK